MTIRVYIAGSYSNERADVVAANVLAAVEAGEQLTKAGCLAFVPQVYFHTWNKFFQHDWDFWMEQCLHWLRCCDIVIRIGGTSVGADREVEAARRLGIRVYYGTEEFLKDLEVAKEAAKQYGIGGS